MFYLLVSAAGRRGQQQRAPQAMASSVCWSVSEVTFPKLD